MDKGTDNKSESKNNAETQLAPKKERTLYSDIFVRNSIYPNAENIFNLKIKPLEEIKDKCIVVLDTSVLLLPYNFDKQGFIERFLEQCKKIYSQLAKSSRLFIPGQVAREFAANRTELLTRLYTQLDDSRKRFSGIPNTPSSLLDSLEEYKVMSQKVAEVNKIMAEVNGQINTLLELIKDWHWNDPVSNIYGEIFLPETIVEIELEDERKREELKKDLKWRQEHGLPPCVSKDDQKKPDGGVGDLLVWHTILKLGQLYKKSVILVSGDKKADWFHANGNTRLYPRFELVEEYYRCSKGGSFYILELSELLKLYKVSDEIVAVVARQEIVEQEKVDVAEDLPILPKRRIAPGNRGAVTVPVATSSHSYVATTNRTQKIIEEYIRYPSLFYKIRSTDTTFASGDIVQHSKFGFGIVISVRLSGRDEEITIAFLEAGVKKLLKSFALLYKIVRKPQHDDEPEDIPF